MARNKALQPNIDGSDAFNYPDKRIRNNSGVGDGTPVDETVYGDIHELMGKIMRDSKTNYNGLPDNVTNGYQLYEAFMSLAGKNDLVKPITVFNATTLLIPVKVNALKDDETIIFKTNFDSDDAYVSIKGSDAIVKTLVIGGSFKNGDLVRIINTPASIVITGTYDSQNVPDLLQRLTNLENAITPMQQKLAVFQTGGGMIFWNKPLVDIPFGYHEVVDWRSRMPVGYNPAESEFNLIGKNGGSKTAALTAANNGPHKHDWKYTVEGDDNGSGGSYEEFTKKPGLIASTDPTNPIGESGTGTPFSILNPYRTVVFIEWTGLP